MERPVSPAPSPVHYPTENLSEYRKSPTLSFSPSYRDPILAPLSWSSTMLPPVYELTDERDSQKKSGTLLVYILDILHYPFNTFIEYKVVSPAYLVSAAQSTPDLAAQQSIYMYMF